MFWSLQAREAVEMRAQIEKKLRDKEREKKEDGLRQLARKAREDRVGIRAVDGELTKSILKMQNGCLHLLVYVNGKTAIMVHDCLENLTVTGLSMGMTLKRIQQL
jgi:hypothetical protein